MPNHISNFTFCIFFFLWCIIYYIKNVNIFIIISRTSKRVFTTVIGINKAPDIDLAVMPNNNASVGVSGSFTCNVCFNQCNDEKYNPTPGTTLVMD